MKFISFSFSASVLSVLFILLSLFHAAIILGMLFFDMKPMDYLWGGRMETPEKLLGYEIISLFTTLLALWLVSIRAAMQRSGSSRSWIRVMLWLMTALFALNTLGNIVAPSAFEKSAAIVTLIMAILTARMAREPWVSIKRSAA